MNLRAAIFFVLIATLALSCSQQKNTIVNRSYHNLTAHYNGFFNGRLALQDAHRKMEEANTEDYSALLPFFIYNKEDIVQGVYPDLDRAIAKTSLVVARHSMDIEGEEHCKWIDDTWMVMAEAQYLKGELVQAKTIVDFARRKYDDPKIKQMCILWSARILAKQEQYSRAGDELRKISTADGFPSEKQGDLHTFKAEYYFKQGKLDDAITEMEQAVALTKKRQLKTRRMFLLAQLYEREGDGIRSGQLYAEVIKRNPIYDMSFYAKINRALAYDANSGNIDEIRETLFKMMKDVKNADFLDQIYYALAELDFKEGKEEEGIANLKLASAKSVKNGNAKGMALYKLGEIYFGKKDYPKAQAYYDSTVNYLSPEHPDYQRILARATSLTQMMRDIETVEREDSLQAFAGLSKKEQEALIRTKIEDLIQREQDEERQKQLEQMQAQQAQFNQGSQINKNITKGDWYFYNAAAVGFGASEFTKIWGQRKNEDMWRRADKTAEMEALSTDDAIATLASDTADGANDPKNANYYWKSVPDSEEKLQRSDALIIEALYDLGMVYKEQMKDDKLAIETFEDLLSRYDSTKYHANCYYQLYLMYAAMGMSPKSNYYKERVLKEFPDTDYARVILNPDYAAQSLAAENQVRDAYEKCYTYYEQNFYKMCYECAQVTMTQFPNSPYHPQLRLLEAICSGSIAGEAAMISALEKVEREFGSHEAGQEATDILSYFRNGKQILRPEEEEASLKEGEAEKAAANYRYDIGAMHNFVMIVPDTADVNALLAIVSDFNRLYFSTKGLKTSNVLLSDGRVMIIVSGVGIANKAMDYLNTFKNAGEATQVIHSRKYPYFVISYDNYAFFYKDLNLDAYMVFFAGNYVKVK